MARDVARPLKTLPAGRVTIFKLRNRRGYAAIALGNLTEGRSPSEAFARLWHPLRRMGFALPAKPPAVQARA
jgi:hypothetical protein